MSRPVVYIETTVISYFASRPSRDVVVAGHQAVTSMWWESELPKFMPVISQIVLDEIATGDPVAAGRRLEAVAGMDLLAVTDEVESLAIEYFQGIGIPEAARADALHLALGTCHGVDYLITWNCRHIASGRVRKSVQEINDRRAFLTPIICTPEELLEY